MVTNYVDGSATWTASLQGQLKFVGTPSFYWSYPIPGGGVVPISPASTTPPVTSVAQVTAATRAGPQAHPDGPQSSTSAPTYAPSSTGTALRTLHDLATYNPTRFRSVIAAMTTNLRAQASTDVPAASSIARVADRLSDVKTPADLATVEAGLKSASQSHAHGYPVPYPELTAAIEKAFAWAIGPSDGT